MCTRPHACVSLVLPSVSLHLGGGKQRRAFVGADRTHMAPLAGGNRLYLKPGFDVVHEARPTPLQSLKRKPIVFVLCACVCACMNEHTHTHHHHHARLLTRLRIASYELRLLGLFTFVQAHILMGQVDDRSLAEFSVCVPCTRALHTRRHYTQMVPIVAACYRLPRNQACCRKPHTHMCVCVRCATRRKPFQSVCPSAATRNNNLVGWFLACCPYF